MTTLRKQQTESEVTFLTTALLRSRISDESRHLRRIRAHHQNPESRNYSFLNAHCSRYGWQTRKRDANRRTARRECHDSGATQLVLMPHKSHCPRNEAFKHSKKWLTNLFETI